MKRLIALSLVAAVATGTAGVASADHVCVTSQGQDVVCTPHPDDLPALTSDKQICVTNGDDTLVCV